MTIAGFACLVVTGGLPPDVMVCRPSPTPSICVISVDHRDYARCWIADKASPTEDGVMFRLQRRKIRLKGEWEW